MKAYVRISARRMVSGLAASILGVTVVVFAIKTYAGPVPALLLPLATALTVFLFMNRELWRASRAAYDAGEIGRRMGPLPGMGCEEHVNESKSTWFQQQEVADRTDGAAAHRPAKKKALPVGIPEGLV